MKKLKRYDEYIKENQEDLETQNELQSDEEIPGDLIVDDEDIDQLVDDEDAPEEEEDNEYIGRKMLKNLAKALGTKVVDNSVKYDGQTINFFSETEMFHIGKKKFKEVDQVVDYLTKSKEGQGSKLPDDIKADLEASDMETDKAIEDREVEDEVDNDLDDETRIGYEMEDEEPKVEYEGDKTKSGFDKDKFKKHFNLK